jgi:flagellar basal-body rod modification protein FlgD
MSAVSGLGLQSAQDLKLDFLNLLVTQLRNQNPLEPLDNAEMTAQLAQISQLEQLEEANASFKEVLAATQAGYAASLLGKEVLFFTEGQVLPLAGTVTSVERLDGEFAVRVGDYLVGLAAIQAIRDQ